MSNIKTIKMLTPKKLLKYIYLAFSLVKINANTIVKLPKQMQNWKQIT